MLPRARSTAKPIYLTKVVGTTICNIASIFCLIGLINGVALGRCIEVEKLAASKLPITYTVDNEIITTISATRIQMLQSVFSAIKRAAGLSPNFGLCFIDEISASADQNRNLILVTSSMIESVIKDNASGAAFILAHEFAHLLNQDSNRIAVASKIHSAIALDLTVSDIERGNISRQEWLASALIIKKALTQDYSRTVETVADDAGLQLMQLAGYDPRGALEAARAMRKVTGHAATSYMDSHPGWDDRISRLEALSRETVAKLERAEKVKEQEPQNSIKLASVLEFIRLKQWTKAELSVNQWLREMPDSAVAWKTKGDLYVKSPLYAKSASARLAGLDAYANSVARNPEDSDSWLKLCVGLFQQGFKLEAAHCARNLKEQDALDDFQKKTFYERLVIGGRIPSTPWNLWLTPDENGKKLITNDRSVLEARNLPIRSLPPLWSHRR